MGADDDVVDSLNCSSWEYSDVLAEKLSWEKWAVSNTVDLLDKGNTVPFIARYRKELTNNMQSDTLRRLSAIYDDLRTVCQKINTAVKSVEKQGKLTRQLKCAFAAAQTKAEVEHLYAPYKTGSKRSLAERARELGLEPLAMSLLTNPGGVNVSSAVNPREKGIATIKEVETGLQHIIADVIYKNKETMDYIRQLLQQGNILLQSTRINLKAKTESSNAKDKVKPNVKVKTTEQNKNAVDPDKFKLYFDFRISVKTIRPHQMLAINRGETHKVLRVKVDIPDRVCQQLKSFCHRRWHRVAACHRKLFDVSIDDAYTRLIQPILISNIRTELTKEAEKASIDVFAQNLKQLLLTPPVRGLIVMGVDPGFRNGCKFAVTSPTGSVLGMGVAYLHTANHRGTETETIRRSLLQHRCDTIAIGNGTACRETECFFSDHIKRGTFAPLRVNYCIVSEAGASIYSASPEAEKELPDMDVTLRGAVSIAKRLQDPLAELVKIEPRHIGVGMYQHDVSESKLKTSLEGVVEDCVSFTGIDLNTCSEILLMKISGLGKVKAHKIVEWRNAHGPFLNRAQLKAIKGLGPKAFEQCAGFVRVLPGTRASCTETPEVDVKEEKASVGRKRKAVSDAAGSKAKRSRLQKDALTQVENLDMTSIHPESYHVADIVITKLGLDKDCIGQAAFISRVKAAACNVDKFAEEQEVGIPTIQLIMDALSQSIGQDIRDEFEKPLFRQAVTTMESLSVGTIVTGRVSNTTHFGAFVDIGVGRDALMHMSQMPPSLMNGKGALQLGDRVEAMVVSIDRHKGHIGLKLSRLM